MEEEFKNTRGIRDSIRTEGGKFLSSGNIPTLKEWEEMLNTIAENQNKPIEYIDFSMYDFKDIGNGLWEFRIGNKYGICGNAGKERFEKQFKEEVIRQLANRASEL